MPDLRSKRSRGVLLAVCLVLVLTPALSRAQTNNGQQSTESPQAQNAVNAAPPSDAGETQSELSWLESMAQGYTAAQRNRKPILVRIGGRSCPYCKLLAAEIKKSEVQQEIADWTLVYIDVDKSPSDARLLGVGPIPALRLLTPTGKIAASHDGTISAEELVAWLRKHRAAAAVIPAKELTGEGPITILTAVRLVRAFKQRDATLREAAVRRLLPHPGVAAVPVVGAFTEGSLSTRLTALELLREWNAPVKGLDPWQPQSFSEAKLKSLSDWASSPDRKIVDQSAKPETLTPQQLTAARRMIAKMISAEPIESRAIRERLSRHGQLLLSEVYAQLKQSETDAARERLTALRYRLVASQNLVLNWPGGLERLAATDVKARQEAADELAKRATLAEELLLLELFSDPAPLVREISLRALQNAGGTSANSALIRLLKDPEPNVRAVVLKQLSESPSIRIVPKIAEYVAGEKDPDLLVHAVRLLREIGGKATAECLMTLLEHDSWRVRAEAAEAIAKVATTTRSSYGPTSGDSFAVDAYVALIRLLEDKDSFVVSRAVTALSKADLVIVVDPMAKVALTHPELAVEVVKVLSVSGTKQAKSIPHLKKFCKHENPKVRAAAIAGLCDLIPDGVQNELRAAFADRETVVRIAAGNALFQALESRRESSKAFADLGDFGFELPEAVPQSPGLLDRIRNIFRPKSPNKPAKQQMARDVPVVAEKPAKQQMTRDVPVVAQKPANDDVQQADETADNETERRLKEIRAGKVHPQWMHDLVDLLKPLLEGESVEERLAGALPLTALGRDQLALPTVHAALESDPRQRSQIASLLPWLLWSDRIELFNRLVASEADMEEIATIASFMAAAQDKRASTPLWKLLSRPDADAGLVATLVEAMRRFYFSDNYYSPEDAPLSKRKNAIADVTPRAKSGGMWQRLAALSILLQIARDDAADISQAIVKDADEAAEFRAQAFRILLLAQTRVEGRKTAIAALSSKVPRIRKLALTYLSMGAGSITYLDDYAFNLRVDWSTGISRTTGQPIFPKAPAGLKPQPLRPLLEEKDAKAAAYAAYLLVLLDEPNALASLIDYWEKHERDDQSWTQLTYRAIAYLDDASRVPLLEGIYERNFRREEGYRHDVGDFYWTIRVMTGPKILTLRKRIRDEVGVDQLR